MLQYEQTTIPQTYSLNICNKSSGVTTIPEEHVTTLVKNQLLAICDYARAVKTKDKPTAVVIEDLKGNLLLAAVVKYHEGEGDMPGNWSFEWTFNEEDVKDCVKYSVSVNNAHSFFINRAKQIRMSYSSPSSIYLGCQEFALTLSSFLDENAKENEEVEIELKGYFVASVIVENGEKIKSITPDGALKRLIKDDATLETL